jgi:hypothetical protein
MIVTLSLRDLKFLLECEEKAQTSVKIGYSGADKTAKELIAALNAKVEVNSEAIEAALFSVQQLQEKGYSVTHPDGYSREALIKRITPQGAVFDKELGIFYKDRK